MLHTRDLPEHAFKICFRLKKLPLPHASGTYHQYSGESIVEQYLLQWRLLIRFASTTMDSIAFTRKDQKLTFITNVELSISDLVWPNLLAGHAPVMSNPATAYEGWGTLDAWTAYTRS